MRRRAGRGRPIDAGCASRDHAGVNVRRLTPSTSALWVFEAAARHLSCKSAANELLMTQGAVSKQLKGLEEQLGVALFLRRQRGLALTQAGADYLSEIRPLLDRLATATLRIAQGRRAGRSITIRVLPSIGERWLLPRFSSFANAHPDVEVQFTTLLSSNEGPAVDADVEFRYGNGAWPGLQADYIAGGRILLVASPTLIARMGAPTGPRDLDRFPVMQHFETPLVWREFAERHGFEPRPGQASRCGYYSVLIRAVLSGLGIALVPEFLIGDELASGTLVNPLGLRVRSRHGYYLVYQERRRGAPAFEDFRSWALDQAARTEPDDEAWNSISE